MKPVDIRPVGETEVLMTWEDEHRSLYSYHYLRFQCPCAGCKDEHTGKRLIHSKDIPVAIKSSEILPVGRYALRFQFSDGHVTGIYSFAYLREICPCTKCQIAHPPVINL